MIGRRRQTDITEWKSGRDLDEGLDHARATPRARGNRGLGGCSPDFLCNGKAALSLTTGIRISRDLPNYRD